LNYADNDRTCDHSWLKMLSGNTSLIGGVLLWCLSFCKFLPSPYMIMEPSNQGPSPLIVQFGKEASYRKCPGCSNLLPLRIMKATCFCEPSLQAVGLTSWLGFYSDKHFRLLDLLLRGVWLFEPYPLNCISTGYHHSK